MGLVVNVAGFVLVAIWVGEPLLKLLGISTAALTATGGIALLYASIPLMRGVGEAPAAEDSDAIDTPEPAARMFAAVRCVHPHNLPRRRRDHLRGGVAASADVEPRRQVLLSVAAVGLRGRHRLTCTPRATWDRRISPKAGMILDRVAASAHQHRPYLLDNGFTDLVVRLWPQLTAAHGDAQRATRWRLLEQPFRNSGVGLGSNW